MMEKKRGSFDGEILTWNSNTESIVKQKMIDVKSNSTDIDHREWIL